MSYTVVLFNKYYGEFLKAAKNAAKVVRDEEEEKEDIVAPSTKLAHALAIIAAIKKSYRQFDHLSEDYINRYISVTAEYYQKFQEQEQGTELPSCEMFDGISNQALATVLPPAVYMHYTALLGAVAYMHAENYTEVDAKDAMEKIRASYTSTVETGSSVLDKYAKALHDIRIQDEGAASEFKEMEETSIGKLAKEIVEELNLTENTNPMDLLSGNGDVFAKMFSAVGGKIQEKLSKGELNQQTLMQDAMQLATKLPSMIPGGMEEMMGGNMQSLLANFQNLMGGAGGGGAGGGLGGLASLAQMMGGLGGGAAAPSARSLSRNADRLKKKLHSRRTGGSGSKK